MLATRSTLSTPKTKCRPARRRSAVGGRRRRRRWICQRSASSRRGPLEPAKSSIKPARRHARRRSVGPPDDARPSTRWTPAVHSPDRGETRSRVLGPASDQSKHALAETSDERPPVRPWTTGQIRDAVRGLPTPGRVPRAFLVRLGSCLLPRPARRLGPDPGHRLRPGRHGTRRRSHPRRRRRPAGPGPLRQDRSRSLVCRGQRLPLQLHPEPRVVGQEGPPRPGADGLAQPPLRRARRPEPPGDPRLRRVRPVRRRPLADRPGRPDPPTPPPVEPLGAERSSMPGARRSPRCVAR